jgi:hypothetical protein
MKHFKYAAAIIIVLFSVLSISADNHIAAHGITKEALRPHRKNSDGRMFLITVIDSNDKDIGKRCEMDLDDITYAFNDIADWLFMDMQEPKIIMGDEFSKAAVNDAIDNWLRSQNPGKDDIVVFYYSGHGFRYPDDASPYPRMWLKTTTDQDVGRNNLSMEEDVYNRIRKMGAGVNLVVSDCCNTTNASDNANYDNITAPARTRVAHKRQQGQEDLDEDLDFGERIFKPENPLSILVTAAEKSEFAAGKADFGGFFTFYLIEALSKCIFDGTIDADWKTIFKYADEKASYRARSAACPEAKHTPQGRCVQTVKFKIDTE